MIAVKRGRSADHRTDIHGVDFLFNHDPAVLPMGLEYCADGLILLGITLFYQARPAGLAVELAGNQPGPADIHQIAFTGGAADHGFDVPAVHA